MSEINVFNAVSGFHETLAFKQQLEQTGTDFSERHGQVKTLIDQLHPKRLQLQVKDILTETATTKTIRFVATSTKQLPAFQAGQYINLFVNIDGVNTARPYAIASMPLELDFYDITVKKADGGFVSHYLVDQLQVGQIIESSGPMGNFYHNPLFHGHELVFLAGGSGSVPAKSMLRDILTKNLTYDFHLIYVNSFEDDVIYADELRQLTKEFPNFKLTEFVTRPSDLYQGTRGRLSLEQLQSLLGESRQQMFYICGPTPFNENCLKLLTEIGIPKRRIRIEANGAPKHPETQLGWPQSISLDQIVTITVKGKGHYQSRVGEPLLNSLERNGFFVENACRSGECSLCRVKLLSGKVFNPQEAHLRKSEQQFGWIYSCVAFPVTDIEVQI